MFNTSQRNDDVLSEQVRSCDASNSSVHSGSFRQALTLALTVEQALLSAECDVAAVNLALTTVEGEAVTMEAFRDQAEALKETADDAKNGACPEPDQDKCIARTPHYALVASATATKSLKLKEQTPSTEKLKVVARSGANAAEKVRLAAVFAAEAKVNIRGIAKTHCDVNDKQLCADLLQRVDASAERIFHLQETTLQNASNISKRYRQALTARTQGDTAVMRTVRISKDMSRAVGRPHSIADEAMSTSEMSMMSNSSSDSSPVCRYKGQDTKQTEVDSCRAPERKEAAVPLCSQRNTSRAKTIDSTRVAASVSRADEPTVPVETPIEPPLAHAHAEWREDAHVHVSCVQSQASCELPLRIRDIEGAVAVDAGESGRFEPDNDAVSDLTKLFVSEHTHEEHVEEQVPVSVRETAVECRASPQGQNLHELEELKSFPGSPVEDLVQRCNTRSGKQVTTLVRTQLSVASEVDKSEAQVTSTISSDGLKASRELCSAPTVITENSWAAVVLAEAPILIVEDTTTLAAADETQAPATVSASAKACNAHQTAVNTAIGEGCRVPIDLRTEPPLVTMQEASQENTQRGFAHYRQDLVVDVGDDASMAPQAPDARSVHDKDTTLVATAAVSSNGRHHSPKAVWEIMNDACVPDSAEVKRAPLCRLRQWQEAVRMAQAELEHWSMVIEKIALSAESALRSAEEAASLANQAHVLAEQGLRTFTTYRSNAEETHAEVRVALQVINKEARLCAEEERSSQLYIQTSDDALVAAQAAIEEELSLMSEPVLLGESDAAVMVWTVERASVTQKIAVQKENMLAAACRREEAARKHAKFLRSRAHVAVTADKEAEIAELVATLCSKAYAIASDVEIAHAAQFAREASEKSLEIAHQASQVQVELRAALELADGAVEAFRQATASLLQAELKGCEGDDRACSVEDHDTVRILFHHTQRRFDVTRHVSAHLDETASIHEHTQQLVQNAFTVCDSAFAAKEDGDAFVAHCRSAAAQASSLAAQARQAEARMIADAETALVQAQEYVQKSREALQLARAAATEADDARVAAETAAQHSTLYDSHPQALQETHIILSPRRSLPKPVSPYVSPSFYSPEESRNNSTRGQAALARVQALRHAVRSATASAEEWTLFAEELVYTLQHSVQTCEVTAGAARDAVSVAGNELASTRTFLAGAKKVYAKSVADVQGAWEEAKTCEETKRVLAKRITIADNVLQDEKASVEEELRLLETAFATSAASARLSEKSQGVYVAQRSLLLSRVHAAVVRREQQALEHVATARASTKVDDAQKHADRVAFYVSEAICLQPNATHSDHLTRAIRSSAQAAEQISAAAANAFESNHETSVAVDETLKACDVALRAAMDLKVWKVECDKLGVDCSQGELRGANNMPWYTQRCSEAARQVEEMTRHILMLQELTQDAAAQVAQQSQQIHNIRSEAELTVRRVMETSREASAIAVRVRQLGIEMIALAEAALARVRN